MKRYLKIGLLTLLGLGACQSHTAPPLEDSGADTDIDSGAQIPENNVNATEPLEENSSNTGTQFSTTAPQSTGEAQHPELTEISGLTSSTRQSNTFWAINDSGNKAKLYALKHTGESIGSWIVNETNRDWEDMASAWINGESYLFIADIGNNTTREMEYRIHVLSEPLLDSERGAKLNSIHTIRFVYPDGNYNSESMSVADGWIYILTKQGIKNNQRQASRVYRLPLQLSGQDGIVTAEYIGSLAIPNTSVEAGLIASLSGVDITQPTAFDIDQQNRHAYVLTYRSVYRYTRNDDQTWAEIFPQLRNRVHTHSLSQAEALAVASNGVIWFTTENRPAPLWALPAAN